MKYDIRPWLNKQPVWLREAAIRLQKKNTLAEKDISDLVKIIKGENRILPDLSDLVTGAATTNTVRLISLSNVRGIDKLHPRKPLDLGSGNLVIVYGRNGSGKSGYARILKKCCGKTNNSLKHNVYDNPPTEQSCEIRYLVNGNEQNQQWDAQGMSIPDLASVDIFDGAVDKFYLTQENEASYTPIEMHLFTALVDVCERVFAFLNEEQGQLISKLPTIPAKFQSTRIAGQYTGLLHNKKQSEIDAMTEFSMDSETRIKDLAERLNVADPAVTAKRRREVKKQIEAIKNSIEIRLSATIGESIGNLRKLLNDATQKRQISVDAAKALGTESKLEGVGNNTWKALWEAAREYSTQCVYRNESFPHTGDQARCVLCHQELDADAKERLLSFEAFIKGALESDAKAAEAAFNDAIQNLPKIVEESDVRTKFQAAELDEVLGNEIWTFIDNINSLVAKMQGKVMPTAEANTIPSVCAVLTKLTELIATAESKAKQFESDAKVFDRDKAKAEMLELEAKQWVAQQKDAVLSEVKRLKDVQKYESWKKDANTRALTIEAGSTSEMLITEGYINRFNSELQHLGAEGITVELVKSKNVKGKGKYRIQLRNAMLSNTNPIDILSDGEKRIIALAAILADVAGQGDNVPFVFDDPISSLDQDFEERTIARLVELSAKRQVIVFTHRLSFLSIITKATEKSGDSLKTIYICSKPWGTGEPAEIPFFGKGTKEALNTLKEVRLKALKAFCASGSDDYEILAKAMCSDFRIVLERIVETVLLADVVQRHRREINTMGKIQNLAKIKKSDCDLIDKMMTKYSCYEHSQSNEAPGQLPSPDDLGNDIIEVLTWHFEFSQRKL
jgi:energy-coupling factor transporter ATP-binding protein EcfA2